jgi:hypothetical protein
MVVTRVPTGWFSGNMNVCSLALTLGKSGLLANLTVTVVESVLGNKPPSLTCTENVSSEAPFSVPDAMIAPLSGSM